MPYLPYEEPGITVILSLTSFLLLLNTVRYTLDYFLYCGIIGEILIGIIWGLPVGGISWLTEGMQETIQAFGYLGLIGLVFEGGLKTNLALLRKSAYLSVSVATIGLSMPIALSFILLAFPFSSTQGMVYPTPLAGFSAGASLCSTSLGTTFAILSSAKMQQTRVGVVLVGAAMMDDVVGLVMVNIVTTLGSGGSGGWPIARPIAASFGMLLITITVSPYLLRPFWRWTTMNLYNRESSHLEDSKSKARRMATQLIQRIPHLGFLLSTTVLIIFVAIASFIDASVLFAAFIAGGVVSFLWGVQLEQQEDDTILENGPSKMYEEYYQAPMGYVLVPFFFASIGFSIPITGMFEGSVVWKGILYSILMIIAKGLVSTVIYFDYFLKWLEARKLDLQLRHQSVPHTSSQANRALVEPHVAKPPHIMALLVGFAMIARGEIGFLIASLSQSSGTLNLQNTNGSGAISSGEEIFLVIIWAVVICTIAGPVGVGVLVRKLKHGNNVAHYVDWM